MVYLICFFVGFAGGLMFCFATDSWRVGTHFNEYDPPFCSDCEGGESYEKCRKCKKRHEEEDDGEEGDY